ncbi:hypothetical protein [Mesorhizobium sp. 1B3]|uniref:hypothetical protein n=1 Tax=Mesorhizobium sp. 1B3 TaxID=3243599 RepID=UPI003D99A12F
MMRGHHNNTKSKGTSFCRRRSAAVNIDVATGQLYLFPNENRYELWEFKKRKRDGSFVLLNDTTEKKKTIPPDEFQEMRCDGRAIRVSRAQIDRDGDIIPGDIDPLSMLGPDDKGISAREKERRRAAGERLMKARTLRFYAIRHDEEEKADAGHGKVYLERIIDKYYQEACAHGFLWRPSFSALQRALLSYGKVGDRPLTAFLTYGKHNGLPFWHIEVLRLKEEMIACFWSPERPRIKDAISSFNARFDVELRRRCELGEAPFQRPTKETLRLWINGAGDRENWCRRFGDKSAKRRFQGVGKCISASRALEYVMFDHTMVDTWARLLDKNGSEVLVLRPWLTLAIDVYSRAILAAVLTAYPPCLHTVMQCLRWVVRPKKFLVDEFGNHKGATDCWGKPSYIIVDNAWEFSGVSFQVACEGAGIHVIWSPVKTPEFKAYIERFFDTLNEEVWHRMPGGIQFTPTERAKLELNPRQEASFTIEELEDRLWRMIVTIYHVEVHEGIGMAPARAWKLSLARFDRPTVDDITGLDKLIGAARVCTLSASGIEVRGHRFHDQAVTSRLLDDLIRFSEGGVKQNFRHPRRGVRVLVTIDLPSCGFVHVWNPRTRQNVKLPNIDEFYTDVSWEEAETLREFAAKENLAFHSDSEKWAARESFRSSIAASIPTKPYREAKQLARHLTGGRHQLVPGDTVVETVAEPSSAGMNSPEIPVAIPASARSDERLPPKGPRRGGRKATRKSKESNALRRSARALDSRQPKPTETARQATIRDRDAYMVPDPVALLAALEADLD